MVKVCPNCKCKNSAKTPNMLIHKRQSKQINPNGEYVEGYGHTPVIVPTNEYRTRCGGCGWREGHNQIKIDIEGNVLGTIGEEDE